MVILPRVGAQYPSYPRKYAHNSYILFDSVNLIHILHILYDHFSYTANPMKHKVMNT